jgi:Tfp pilus assembly protein PilN
VGLFEFESVPRKAVEFDALVRWRFQQEFNFSAAQARLDCRMFRPTRRFARSTGGSTRVLAVAIREEIVSQYERACESVGLIPLNAGLTSLTLFESYRSAMETHLTRLQQQSGISIRDCFLLCRAENSFMVIALRDGIPVLVRTKTCEMDRTGTAACRADLSLVREVLATLHFYADQYAPPMPPAKTAHWPLFVLADLGYGTDSSIPESDWSGLMEQAAEAGLPLTVIHSARLAGSANAAHSTKAGGGAGGVVGARRGARTMKWPVSLPHLSCALAAHGFGLLRAIQAGLVAVILASLLWAVWLYSESRFLNEEAVRYEQADARVREAARRFQTQATQAGFDMTEARLQTLKLEVTFANRLLEKRVFSWTRLLSDLEEAVPAHVSVSVVSISFKDSTIALNGTALTLQDVTTLVNALERHPVFHSVTLGQHRIQGKMPDGTAAAKEQDPARHVSFSLTVTYQAPDTGAAKS